MEEKIDEETENHEALAEESKDTVPEKVNISLYRFLTWKELKENQRRSGHEKSKDFLSNNDIDLIHY